MSKRGRIAVTPGHWFFPRNLRALSARLWRGSLDALTRAGGSSARHLTTDDYEPPRAGAVLLGLLASSGQIKMSPPFVWLPVDLTVICVLGIAITSVWAIARSGRPPSYRKIAPFLALALLVSFALPQAGANEYADMKVLTFFTATLLLALSPLALLTTQRSRATFLASLTAIASFVGVGLLLYPTSTSQYTDVVSFADANPIAVAQTIACGSLICVLGVFAGGSAQRRLSLLVGGLALAFLMTLTGSRGPFLALVLAFMLPILISPVLRRVRLRAIAAALVVGVLAVVWLSNSSNDGGQRILSLFMGEQDTSTDARQNAWISSLQFMTSGSWATGFGEFGSTSHSQLEYPHNIVLEMFVEVGPIAGLLFSGLLVLAITRTYRSSSTPEGAVAFALLVFALTCAFVSGDLNDNRLLWILLGMALVLPPGAPNWGPAFQSGAGSFRETNLRP